jgi:hypothetical protein
VPLPRTDHRHAVTPQGKAVDQPSQRHGDPIDFRRVRFGDEGEVQGVCPQAVIRVAAQGEGRMAGE